MPLQYQEGFDATESNKAVVMYLIILPIGCVVFMFIYRRIIGMLCGPSEHQDRFYSAIHNRKVATAPIMSRLPHNFHFTNYVTDKDDDSSQWPSSAMSLNKAIHSSAMRFLPCTRWAVKGTRAQSDIDVDLTIPHNEQRGTITKQLAKMGDVARWLESQADMTASPQQQQTYANTLAQKQLRQEREEQTESAKIASLARGGALLAERTGGATITSVRGPSIFIPTASVVFGIPERKSAFSTSDGRQISVV